jgi:hygromycin-B 4-O-kinase
VHGDFGSNNVLSDGQSITGIIDCSEAMVGDPLYDVANIFFWRTWLNCMDQLASFFEHTVAFTEDARTLLLCYQLHIGLREFYESSTQGNHSATAWAKARLKELLRQAQ